MTSPPARVIRAFKVCVRNLRDRPDRAIEHRELHPAIDDEADEAGHVLLRIELKFIGFGPGDGILGGHAHERVRRAVRESGGEVTPLIQSKPAPLPTKTR